jgi:hypothetical protein
VSEKLYGGKCHICAHLRHQGEQSRDPVDWLPRKIMECATCAFCQEASLHRLLMDTDHFIFSPEVREAKQAFRWGRSHPILDELRKSQ